MSFPFTPLEKVTHHIVLIFLFQYLKTNSIVNWGGKDNMQ